MSLTPADQFNIILLNSSAIVSSAQQDSPYSDPYATSKIEITRPSIRVMDISNIPCLYTPGALYKVKSDVVMFYMSRSPSKQAFIDLPNWLDEWYAEDSPQKEGDILLFLGVLRYDLRTHASEDIKSIYALKFLSDEKIVQYLILKLITTDNMGYMTEGEGLVVETQERHKKKIAGSLMTILQKELEPLCHSETQNTTNLPTP